jgi:hypothetical protein
VGRLFDRRPDLRSGPSPHGRKLMLGTYRDDEVALSGHPLGALKQDLRSATCVTNCAGAVGEAQVVDYLVTKSQNSRCRRDWGASLPALRRQSLFMVATLDHLIGRGLIARERGWRPRRSTRSVSPCPRVSAR